MVILGLKPISSAAFYNFLLCPLENVKLPTWLVSLLSGDTLLDKPLNFYKITPLVGLGHVISWWQPSSESSFLSLPPLHPVFLSLFLVFSFSCVFGVLHVVG